MAKDRLTLYDKYGNERQVDISAGDVTLDNEGRKTLEQKLAEVDEGIGEQVKKVVFNGTTKNASNGTIDLGNQMQPDWNESSQSYPSYIRNKPNVVTGIRIGSSGGTMEPTNGVVTLPESEGGTVECDPAMSSTSEKPVQNKVIKAYVDAVSQRIDTLIGSGNVQGAIDTFNEVVAFLNGINSSDTLAAKLALKANSSDLQNYATKNELSGKLSQSDVSVETQGNGTVDINVGSGANKDTYTINLNHTHENMAKLEKHTPSTLPDVREMEDDTIYAEVEDGEVSVLYIGGVPFYGGGGGASSGPVLRRPINGATIDMGQTTSGTVSQPINVKGKSLTQALTIQLNGTGYSFGTTQPSGVTRDSATQLTIPASSISAVNSLNGVDIVVVYTGSDTDEDASGTLGINSASPDSIDREVALIVNKTTYVPLLGVKLTGTQWLQTNYKPNEETEFAFDIGMENVPSASASVNELNRAMFTCAINTIANTDKVFRFFIHGTQRTLTFINNTTSKYTGPDAGNDDYQMLDLDSIYNSRGVLSYEILSDRGKISLGTQTDWTSKQSAEMEHPLMIGYGRVSNTGTDGIFNYCDLVIYGIVITEGDEVVRNYVPVLKNGTTPGLLDTTDHDGFIESAVAGAPLVAVTSNS